MSIVALIGADLRGGGDCNQNGPGGEDAGEGRKGEGV